MHEEPGLQLRPQRRGTQGGPGPDKDKDVRALAGGTQQTLNPAVACIEVAFFIAESPSLSLCKALVLSLSKGLGFRV